VKAAASAIVLMLMLAGCVNQASIEPSANLNWQQHQAQIAALQSWGLEGKLGFKNARQGGSANLSWKQDQQQYSISLSGPFGAGSALIEGDQYLASMHQGHQIYSNSPELLAQQLTGLAIPVNALSWWARGLPSPAESPINNLISGPSGAATSFEQAGWQLSFSGYRRKNDRNLPGKITGEFGEQSFKLIISAWSIPQP
jgi:outer membrane lipoprotein LolB